MSMKYFTNRFFVVAVVCFSVFHQINMNKQVAKIKSIMHYFLKYFFLFSLSLMSQGLFFVQIYTICSEKKLMTPPYTSKLKTVITSSVQHLRSSLKKGYRIILRITLLMTDTS